MHRPMSASIRAKSGTRRSVWSKDVEQTLKDIPGADGAVCRNTSRLSSVSNGSRTRPSSSHGAVYGQIPKRPTITKRLRPQTAHPSRTSGLPETRSVQAGEPGLAPPPTPEATAAGPAGEEKAGDAVGQPVSEQTDEGMLDELEDIRTDDDALSVSELDRNAASGASPFRIKSWTGVFPERERSRPSTAPVNKVHSSGSRFFTSTEAFEEYLMTSESKFRNQHIRR